MNGFHNSYRNIFNILQNPAMGQMLQTPASKQEWRRFFGMMETLERNQIATFQNGRYVLHPSRKADVVTQAEAVLAEISKSLTLPEVQAEPAPVSAVVMPQVNSCPTCKGKGRVSIEDTFGYFGSFPCLTCGGKKQIPVPPRSSFPPVDLSAIRVTPNALLFSDKPKAALVPQALEVGGVHVLVEAPAPVLSVTAKPAEPMVLAEDEDTQPLPKLVPADCLTCSGSGNVFDDASEHPYIRVRGCPDCGGTGELQELPLPDVFQPAPLSPLEKVIASQFPEILPGVYVPDSSEGENPAAIKAAVCTECGSNDMCHAIGSDPACTLCIDCCLDKNEPVDASKLEAPALTIPALTAGEAAEAVQAVAEPAIQKHYVRINTTGRGLSSGKYELIRREYKYGRSWMVVKFTTAEELPHWFPAEKCELVVAPNNEPKVIEPVIAPRPSLLRGQQVFQALNGHGFEETKAALNALHAVVVAEILNGNKALLTEGQGT
jgi:hypothetical protein